MTCPRCGTRSPRIKYCRVGFICLVCGCPWDEEEEDERAWGILHSSLFCAVHPPGAIYRPPATTVPKREWPDYGNNAAYSGPAPWKSDEYARLFSAWCSYECDTRNAAVDFCERELQKLWERVE